jgi:hypothetical protein
MALCFVANKDLTKPYSAIARQLREHEDIVWLSPSHRWTRFLLSEGWPAHDILNMPDFADEWRRPLPQKPEEQLHDLEREAPETIGNIIRMCRYLHRQPASFAYAYLAVARTHIERFLRERNVEIAFGEGTWGFELITWLICRRLGLPMLTPSTARHPTDRFYFADAVSADLYAVDPASPEDRSWAEGFLSEWRNRPVQPRYMANHARGYKNLRLRWLGEFATAVFRPHLDRDDATLWPIEARIADRVRRSVNAQAIRWLSPFERSLPKERYVLYTLHHQPEASIDVFGSLNSNQAQLIDSVSRLLPATHKLWVKEHKGAIGDRSLAWLRRIKKLPNVRMVDPFEDVLTLIRNADLVVTVSGTAAYEAALMGIPAVGLSSVFFARLLDNQPTIRSHPLEWNLRELLARRPSESDQAARRKRAVEFLAHLHANSYVGDPIDVEAQQSRRTKPGYLAREAEAFATVARGTRRRGCVPLAVGGAVST